MPGSKYKLEKNFKPLKLRASASPMMEAKAEPKEHTVSDAQRKDTIELRETSGNGLPASTPKSMRDGNPKVANHETNCLHQRRVAFFEKNFPNLFSNDWLDSPEIYEFIEKDRAFVPPPKPTIIRNNATKYKANTIPVTIRYKDESDFHFELGEIGNSLKPYIPTRQNELIRANIPRYFGTRAPGENAAAFLETHKHAYYTFIANYYLTRFWEWNACEWSRYPYLTNPYKIARITRNLQCTIEDYIEVFG